MDNLLTTAQSVYIIGIKGNGTSALASVLRSFGKSIRGSDVREDFATKPLLDSLSIEPEIFGSIKSFDTIDLVIYSTSVSDSNSDLMLAKKEKIPTMTYPQALGILASMFTTSIAVCGSHGKSTITSLLGHTFEQGGLDPTVLVGAEVVNWKRSARSGGKEFFIFEADEYQNKFKQYHPKIIVINNINFEHPDFFKDFDEYKNAFEDFIQDVPKDGLVVANRDHPVVEEIVMASIKNVLWYGEHPQADIRLTARTINDDTQILEINNEETMPLQLIGKHNALNALPVIALAKHFGVQSKDLSNALNTFKSTKRRLEFVGDKDGKIIIDDFAHHPVEIVASISALKEAYPDRRMLCIFQAHTFTRTEVLLKDFAIAFKEVDELILIPIFGSARETKGKINTEDLKNVIQKYTPNVHIIENNTLALEYLKENSQRGDLIVTMGAGDTWQIARDFAV
jgi:UDP-N-acetylmuramate--alanine ligase